MDRLRDELVVAGRGQFFDAVKECLAGERATTGYEQLAQRLGMSEGALKVAVHRLRKRYRELLREEIERTVETESDVEAEIRSLFAVLG